MSSNDGLRCVLADTHATITSTNQPHDHPTGLPPLAVPVTSHHSPVAQHKPLAESCESTGHRRTHRRQPSYPLDPSMFTLELLAGTAAASVRDANQSYSCAATLTSSSDSCVRPRSHPTKQGRLHGERNVRWSVPNESSVAEETQSESEEFENSNRQRTERVGRKKSQFSRRKEGEGRKEETVLAGAIEREWTQVNVGTLLSRSLPLAKPHKRKVHQRCSSNPEDVTSDQNTPDRSTQGNLLSKNKTKDESKSTTIQDTFAREKAKHKQSAVVQTHIGATLDVGDDLSTAIEGSERARELQGQGTLREAMSRLDLDVGRRNKLRLWSPKTSPKATKDGTQPPSSRQLPLASRLLAKFGS